MGEIQWKRIPLENCGASRLDWEGRYEITGAFLSELLQMAYLLSSGDKIDADTRRDMAQRIQAAITSQTFSFTS